MISDRIARDPTHGTAVLIRLVAFLSAGFSLIIVPAVLASAVAGHTGVAIALTTSAIAITVALAAGFAARCVDPLRRQTRG